MNFNDFIYVLNVDKNEFEQNVFENQKCIEFDIAKFEIIISFDDFDFHIILIFNHKNVNRKINHSFCFVFDRININFSTSITNERDVTRFLFVIEYRNKYKINMYDVKKF